MKSSISISNWIADVVVIVFPVGNITVRGAIVYTVAGSCAANLWLTNDCIAPSVQHGWYCKSVGVYG